MTNTLPAQTIYGQCTQLHTPGGFGVTDVGAAAVCESVLAAAAEVALK